MFVLNLLTNEEVQDRQTNEEFFLKFVFGFELRLGFVLFRGELNWATLHCSPTFT